MISNRNIIVFGDDWGRHPSTLQHICKEFIKNNRLIWLGSFGHRKPKLNLSDIKRAFQKLKSVFDRKSNDNNEKNIIKLNPFVWPLHDYNYFRNKNCTAVVNVINEVCIKNKIDKPIVFTSTPLIAHMLGKLNETSSHYFCLDDYSEFDGAFPSLIDYENDLLKNINSVHSVSQTLLKTRIPNSGESLFLPQGVNTKHFIKTEVNHEENPFGNSNPVVGFFGLIEEWIDLELIKKSALHYPKYNFLLVGKVATDISLFDGIENIKLVGEVDYNKLPQMASFFDVGIIPFKINKLTISVNPLKLLEYFSLGLPVVSTFMPEVAKFKPLVYCDQKEDEFIGAIKNSIETNNESLKLERLKTAEKYSWKNIAENISQRIELIENTKN